MTIDTSDRPYDVVLFGATGFTGGLTAKYLARNLPAAARCPVPSFRRQSTHRWSGDDRRSHG